MRREADLESSSFYRGASYVLTKKIAGEWFKIAAALEKKGKLGALKTYKGQTTRAERLVFDDWRERKSPPLHHLPPFCCWKVRYSVDGGNRSYGKELLAEFRWGSLQYVCWQSLLSIVTIIMQMMGNYHEGSLSLANGYIYVAMIRKFSQAYALYTLVLFYQGCKKLLTLG